MKNRRRYISEPNSNGPGDFFLVCLLSLICHAVFFISLFFLNDFQFSAPKPKVITVDLVAFAPGASPAAKLHGSEKSSKPLDASAGDNADRVNPDAVSDLSSQPAESAEAEVPTIKPEGGLQSKPDNLKDLIAAREDESPKEEPVVEKESPKEEPVVEKEPPKEEPVVEKEPPKEEPVVEKESPKEELVLKKKKQAEEVKKKLEQDLAKAQKEQAEKKKKQAQAAKKKLEQDLAKAQKESAEKKKKQAQAAKKKLEQDLAKAQKEQAEKLEKENQTQLRKALDRMKASVASRGNGAQGTNSGGNRSAGASGIGSGSGVGASGVGSGWGAGPSGVDPSGLGRGGGIGEAGPLTLYQMVIKSAIEQNWVFNDAMAGINKNLEVRIFIKILKSGDIRDISFETRSGNNYLDESAKKAIQRANPLPELPKGMTSYELVLGFSPQGLK
ncbi:cell envelope integrity protein TolA [Desulfobacter postgatei]|uniref:cell envelope integrity protein TolA n=1 Tax=Desulfobacter postgatei TaxID=2293 RepID=UPI002A35E3E7|nr:cell envelope integrity protein TolA [Desulfobacter postgatei]MDX9963795.1 cell envelope integrity protein TolA [Desulfobacter postgatei]